jgi:hypothetical protein
MAVYNVFLYETQSGILIWKKSFENLINNKKVALFSSFFSAMQSFIKQLIDEKSGQSIKNIEMGNYLINNTTIPKLGIDLIILADQSEEPHLKDVASKLVAIIMNHSEVIKCWNQNSELISVLDYEFLQVLRDSFSLLEEVSISKEKQRELETSQKEIYLEEYNFLSNRFDKVGNLLDKLNILDQMDLVAKNLENEGLLKKNERLKKELKKEIETTKNKVEFYLSRAKQCISENLRRRQTSDTPLYELGYRDAYIDLYSFSKKLKLIGRLDLADKYYKISKLLIDKPKEMKDKFPSILKEIMTLPDDADEYFKEGSLEDGEEEVKGDKSPLKSTPPRD